MSGPAILGRGDRIWPAPLDWVQIRSSVRGPLLTLAIAVACDILARHGLVVTHPFLVLLLTVVYAAASGGLRPGLVSALLTTLYGVHFLSLPGTIVHYTPSDAYTLLVLALVSPAMALIVARLRAAADRARGIELTRAEAEALDRRLSLLNQASAILASSLDYTETLRDLSRLLVPSMADWCAIHVTTEQGALRFVAGAHRDPARDLVVRALCEYGGRGLPFGDHGGEEVELVGVNDRLLRDQAEDEEQLKLYRALAPSAYIRVPLMARGRRAGILTLVASREYGRRLDLADRGIAGELGVRGALALDNARLWREAGDSDRRYRLLFEGNPQPMWVFDVETLAFLAVNEAAIQFYGYSRDEFLAMSIMDILPPDDTPGFPSGMERPHREEVALAQHQRKDGSIVDMEIISHELELEGRRARLVLATALAERTRTRVARRQSEEQLRNAQRLNAAGRLASGVAHDFNNLLTAIQGFSDLLLRDLPAQDRKREDVEQIRRAADRGALLTRQLLTLGRNEGLQPRLLDPSAMVDGMEGLIQRLVGADIRVETRFAPRMGRVKMDPGQLEQVLINLVLNARDGMPSGGSLTIETAERHITGAARGPHVRPGWYVTLAVSDTGGGMDGEALSHLFEPFYSSPSPSPSPRSGLGLSIVYAIVRQNGGVVRVSSEPGQGTTVKVYLPRVEEESTLPAATGDQLRGHETVLLAEDEAGVRELLRKILTEHGHIVLEARHGRDALLIADRHPRPIHLLVTDVVMPELGGRELAEALARKRPDLKVLYISGYTNAEVGRRGVLDTETAFIQKPFTAEQLMRKVRETLGPRAATA
jgi:PAS domain S-box-containing protein